MSLFQIPFVANPFDGFNRGDHVRVWRWFYWHHAIYIGNGWLIEFGGNVLGGPVAYVGWNDFARGDVVERVTHTLSYSPAQIVARAESRLGETGFFPLTNNCEHFATWCATGQSESPQAQLAGCAIALLAVVIVANHPGARRLFAA